MFGLMLSCGTVVTLMIAGYILQRRGFRGGRKIYATVLGLSTLLVFTGAVLALFSGTSFAAEGAAAVAKELKLDGYKAELLPGDKVDALKDICRGDTKKTIYVGDGVNDGPVLVTSETGIAMGGFGSQVAVEVADAVILDDSPAKVADLLRIAKKTRAIVWENVVMALGVKGIFLIFGVAGLAGLWEAVFADVGVALLAILNSTRATRIK